MEGGQDYTLLEDIDVDIPANSLLRPEDRLYLNLVHTDLEHSYFKPGTYTVEGGFGEYSIDKFRIIIDEE
ncbi:MAG TPA: hypothetical protein GXX36_09675 [Clostridiaceae bacterium]|nr:hypothetical protein [Clostridiaceae bacterium]